MLNEHIYIGEMESCVVEKAVGWETDWRAWLCYVKALPSLCNPDQLGLPGPQCFVALETS